MTDRPSDRDSEEDAILDQLIRECRDKEPADGFARPDRDMISAYLMGTATEEQVKVVRSALARSEEFRREILEMAQDMDAVADLDLTVYDREAQQIPVPDLQELLRKKPEPIPVPAERVSFWTKLKKSWGRLIERRIPQLYAPAFAVAAVLAVVIMKTGWLTPDRGWSLVSKNMEQGLLVSNLTREAVGPRKDYSTPELAALAEFRFLLKFEAGQFLLDPVKERPEPPSVSRRILLRLVDRNDKMIQEFTEYVPIMKVGAVGRVTAWALGLPARNLYSLEMKSDTLTVRWTENMGFYGCVTFTYREQEGYRAVVGFTFDLR